MKNALHSTKNGQKHNYFCFGRVVVWFISLLTLFISLEQIRDNMSKFGRRIKVAPEGFDYVEPILTALENELRESECKLFSSVCCMCL
jgi:hypothetical protein